VAEKSVSGAFFGDTTGVTLPQDSVVLNVNNEDSIIDKDDFSIDTPIHYFGKDSTVTDIENEVIRLYGDAWVKYGTMQLNAAYIEFGFKDYMAKARGVPDSTGKLVGKAKFKDGETEITEDSLAFNFKSKRGISYGARTQQGEAYLIAGVSKRQANEWVHIKNGMLTTCDAERPHYHFRLSKAIVIPDDKVVSGPLLVKFRKIPTPLALPFGFFPNKKESTQGLIMPGYGNAKAKGYFLQNLGYYLPLGKYLDTRMLFDVYSRGSWMVRNVTNYKKLYQYSGSFNISRTTNLNGDRDLPGFSKQITFNVRWNHTQDSKARPGSSLNANVNLGSNQNFRNNLNSSQQDFLSSTFQSAVQYGKSWSGTPFSMALSANHTQNTQSKNVQLTLPSATFTMSRINILKDVFVKNPVGINWTANAENFISAGDSAFRLSQLTRLSRQMQNGVRHSSEVSTSIKLFKGIVTLNPSANLNWLWTFRYLQPNISADQKTFKVDTLFGFRQALTWNAGASFNTRVFGTFSFRNGSRIKAIRHFIQPAVGMSYTPYRNYQQYGYYGNDGSFLGYSPWDAARFKPSGGRETGSVNFSINQNIEAKVRDRKAVKLTYKKVKLIESFKMSANWNFMADSIRWSNVNINGFTTLAKGTTLTYSSTYNLYDRDSLGRAVNRFLFQSNGKLARMQGTTVALAFKLGGNGSNQQTSYNSITQDVQQNQPSNLPPSGNNTIPWSLTLNYSFSVNKQWKTNLQKDANTIRQAATLDGSITLFKRWALSANTGYDFVTKKPTTTLIGLNWDLHCWELKASYIPFGVRASYMVQLNIKSQLLKDARLQQRFSGKPLLY
jgi:hypothetical protein